MKYIDSYLGKTFWKIILTRYVTLIVLYVLRRNILPRYLHQFLFSSILAVIFDHEISYVRACTKQQKDENATNKQYPSNQCLISLNTVFS